MSIHNILFSIYKENNPKLSKICRYWILFKGLKKEFLMAVANEPSGFEPLKFYCKHTISIIIFGNQNHHHAIFLAELSCKFICLSTPKILHYQPLPRKDNKIIVQDLYSFLEWMNCDLTSFSTVLQSCQDDGWMITKGYVQWNAIYGSQPLRRIGLKRGMNPEPFDQFAST